ncbi:MAG: hypothetical protein ACO395_04700 [Pontimonas sp.]
MGADFIGASVPIYRTRDEAIKALHELNDEAIKLALHNTNLDPEFDDGTFWSIDDNGELQMIRETLIPELEKCVHITYDVAEDKHRVAAWFRHDDVKFAVAGGLSWGDTPDFVDELSIVYFLGVTYDPTKKLAWVDR